MYSRVLFGVGAPNLPIVTSSLRMPVIRMTFWNNGCHSMTEVMGCSSTQNTAFAAAKTTSTKARAARRLPSWHALESFRPKGFSADLKVEPRLLGSVLGAILWNTFGYQVTHDGSKTDPKRMPIALKQTEKVGRNRPEQCHRSMNTKVEQTGAVRWPAPGRKLQMQ